ncbi:iron uptake transporter deferrochelatase/peroxidase subunit [soil metagenome]
MTESSPDEAPSATSGDGASARSSRAKKRARPANNATTDDSGKTSLSRRGLLGLAGAGVVGAGVGFSVDRFALPHEATASSATYPFFGANQSGIVTPAQDRLHIAAFDLDDNATRADVISLLKDWTYAAARMQSGKMAGTANSDLYAPPDDTGEALDLPPGGLTITFGFGPTLFTKDDVDRFGVAPRRPAALIDLPHFAGEALDPNFTGGDLVIQACSDDPQVAVHAIRNLSRIAFGRASIRWSQLGFGRTSSTSRSQSTPRNLFGFKDGTANLRAEDTKAVNTSVWAKDGWMDGGSYLVARKIRMTIEVWDRQLLGEQERVIGRDKREGAPLSGGTEYTALDLSKKKAGAPAIDPAAHVRLASAADNDGAVMLRRGYNFVEGNDEFGRLNAGLFFISFQADPRTQFVPIQLRLSKNDAMNEYIKHVGSGIFAVPPGASSGSYVGAGLFS